MGRSINPPVPERPAPHCSHYHLPQKVKRRDRYMLRVCPSCKLIFMAVPVQAGEMIAWVWKEHELE